MFITNLRWRFCPLEAFFGDVTVAMVTSWREQVRAGSRRGYVVARRQRAASVRTARTATTRDRIRHRDGGRLDAVSRGAAPGRAPSPPTPALRRRLPGTLNRRRSTTPPPGRDRPQLPPNHVVRITTNCWPLRY